LDSIPGTLESKALALEIKKNKKMIVLHQEKIPLGFTLPELLVVLLIMSLLAGVTIPYLTKMYDSVQMAFQRDEIIAQLGSLNYLAFQQGQGFTLIRYPPKKEKVKKEFETFFSEDFDEDSEESETLLHEDLKSEEFEQDNEENGTEQSEKQKPIEILETPIPLELPEGWQIRTKKPILFRANGACSGGMLYLYYQTQKYYIQLVPPFCEPKELQDEELLDYDESG
jgi:prepilin-type N-terminal cleavage/methylation domain-containing protein